jgi:hypothetical protein
MGDELVRLCNEIESYGLVDHEYGVWEEQIIDSRCDPFLLYGMCIADVLLVMKECRVGIAGPGRDGGVGPENVFQAAGLGTTTPVAARYGNARVGVSRRPILMKSGMPL